MVKTDQTQTDWFAVLLDLILSVTLQKMYDLTWCVDEFFTRSSERKIKRVAGNDLLQLESSWCYNNRNVDKNLSKNFKPPGTRCQISFAHYIFQQQQKWGKILNHFSKGS